MTFTPTVLTDAFISIDSNTISDHGNKVEIPVKAETLDATTFGQTWMVNRGGLKSATLNITLFNDFSASNLDSIMWPLVGTVVDFEVRPTSSAVGSTNPSYTGSILIDSWTPLSGKVGELDSVDVSFPTSGEVTRATS